MNITVTNEKKEKTLTKAQETYWPEVIKSQYLAGFRRADLSLTKRGKNVLRHILAKQVETELTKEADARLAK